MCSNYYFKNFGNTFDTVDGGVLSLYYKQLHKSTVLALNHRLHINHSVFSKISEKNAQLILINGLNKCQNDRCMLNPTDGKANAGKVFRLCI